MKPNLRFLSAGALVFTAINQACAQYTPPPSPAPFAGWLNEYMRKEDPVLAAWDIGGNLRLRFEDHEGYGIPGRGLASPPAPVNSQSMDFRAHNSLESNSYFMERLRFHVGYTAKWWSAYVEGESSMVDGDKRLAYFANPLPPSTRVAHGDGPESDSIDLHQAFVTIGNLKEFPLSLKVGRQELSYGEERLVGAFGWNNIARTFDAVKLRWQNEWFSADFFSSHVVIPEDNRFDVDNGSDLFSGVYATSTKIPKTILEGYFLARNASGKAISAEPSPQFPQPSKQDIYTIGGRLKSKPGELGNWDYTIEGAYQFGDFLDTRVGAPTKLLQQDAFMAILQGGYTFNAAWGKPRLGIEYSYASGDHNSQDGTHGTFVNLFPTNHKFYGYMDFVSLQNIQDFRGIFQMHPHPRVTVSIEGHGFWLADSGDNFYTVAGAPRGGKTITSNVGTGKGYGVNPGYDAFVGTELDVTAGVALNRWSQLEMGYGHFFTGKYIQQSLSDSNFGSRDADFVYTQLTVNF